MNYLKGIIITILIAVVVAVTCRFLYQPPLKDESGVVVSQPARPAQFDAIVAAYCPGPCCCGKWADGYTASGVPAVGKIVAAPPNIAFGTVLIIPGYGVAVVRDRGGAITGNKLDVLFATHQEALEWGVQRLRVKARMEAK